MGNTPEERKVVDAVPKQLSDRRRVAGRQRRAARLRSTTPRPARRLCEVADASADDALAALDAAVAAQAAWAATPPNERARDPSARLRALGEPADELALLMTLEMGKAVAESKGEIAYAAEFFRWFSGEAAARRRRLQGRPATGRAASWSMRQPVGPCYFITPWNFPNAMGTRKIGPAIAAGCTMVVKPAQQTPLSMLALAQLLEECGLPAGRAQRGHLAPLERGRRRRSSPTRGCASSRSPARPRWAAR